MRVKEFTKFLALIALCIVLLVVGRTYHKQKLVRINQLCTGVFITDRTASVSLTVLFGFVAIVGSDLCTQHCCQPRGTVGVVSGCESAPVHQCLCRL